MIVRRVHDDSGSHIEPPHQAAWSELKQLRWLAEVVMLDVRFRIRVEEYTSNFNIILDRPGLVKSIAVGDFRQAWSMLNGIHLGSEMEQ